MLYPDEDASLLLHSVESRGRNSTACKKPENGAGEAMQPPKTSFSKKKSTVLQTKYSAFLVENSGIEPLTSCMPCKRSPS